MDRMTENKTLFMYVITFVDIMKAVQHVMHRYSFKGKCSGTLLITVKNYTHKYTK